MDQITPTGNHGVKAEQDEDQSHEGCDGVECDGLDGDLPAADLVCVARAEVVPAVAPDGADGGVRVAVEAGEVVEVSLRFRPGE